MSIYPPPLPPPETPESAEAGVAVGVDIPSEKLGLVMGMSNKPMSIASAIAAVKIRETTFLRIIENLLGSIGGFIEWGARPEIPASIDTQQPFSWIDKVLFRLAKPFHIRLRRSPPVGDSSTLLM